MALVASAATLMGYMTYRNSNMERMILNANLEALSESDGVVLKDCGVRGFDGDPIHIEECVSGISENYAVPCGSVVYMSVVAKAKCPPR